jgi:hypothetical protein
MGQGAKLSVLNTQLMNVDKAAKAESRGGATSQPPKAGQVEDPGVNLLGQRGVFKTEFPHLVWGRN